METTRTDDAFEKKLKRLINKLEHERQALSKILKTVERENNQKQLNK
jgi:hypothetical protein